MVGDTNSSLGMPYLPGCPALRNQLTHRRSAGTPRRYRAARCRACTCPHCRHALGRRRGSPRLAGPGREQLSPHIRSTTPPATRTRGRAPHQCPRLHAAPSVRSSIKVAHVRCRQAGRIDSDALTDGEGAPVRSHRDARIQANLCPRDHLHVVRKMRHRCTPCYRLLCHVCLHGVSLTLVESRKCTQRNATAA